MYLCSCMFLQQLDGILSKVNGVLWEWLMIIMLLLTPVLVSETRKYLWNDRLDDYSNEEPPAIGDRSV